MVAFGPPTTALDPAVGQDLVVRLLPGLDPAVRPFGQDFAGLLLLLPSAALQCLGQDPLLQLAVETN